MRAGHGRVAGGELGAGGVEGCAGSKAGEDFGHAVFAAGNHGGAEMVRAGDDIGDDFRGHGVGNRWLQDADNGCGARAHGAF